MIKTIQTMRKIFLSLVISLFTLCGIAQKVEIKADDLQEYVTFLASDSLKGRKPGTPEMEVAAGYIRDHFASAGLKMLSEDGFQWFDVVLGVKAGEENHLMAAGFKAAMGQDFVPLVYSTTGKAESEAVFAGYGFDIDQDNIKWNDYQGLDVAGKWVIILRGDPEPEESESQFIPFSDLRSKVLTARDKGAAGVLFVTPSGMDKVDKLMHMSPDNNEASAGLPVFHISRNFADHILAYRTTTVDSLEKVMTASRKPAGFSTGVKVYGSAEVIRQNVRTANVVALLENPESGFRDEYLVVGAHYDHLGMGGSGSGSRVPDTIAVHNGADDNASGTAMVMALADKLASQRQNLRRSVIFVAFSAEEMGLLGSKYFVSHPPVGIKAIKAMFNFDMVGRFDKEKNSISVSGTGTSLEADSILKALEQGLPFDVVHSPDGYGPSDHAAFYTADIPVFFINTGVHTDYHTPFDDTWKLDFQTQKMVGDYAAGLIMAIDNMDKPLTFKESGKKEGSGRGGRRLKVTLGVMPDFAGTGEEGLRIDGVTKEGPADKGGMKKGDVIVAMNGMKVGNIYEYMSRLQKLKPGMTVNVEILRNGRKEVLLIQL